MRYVGQQDQSLLRSQLFLAAAFEFQAALVGLDFSLTRTAIIVVCDDFGECPSQHGADDRAILGLALTGLPPQDQMLGRAHVGDGGAGWGYPAPVAQILPVLGGDLLRIRWGRRPPLPLPNTCQAAVSAWLTLASLPKPASERSSVRCFWAWLSSRVVSRVSRIGI